LDRKEAASHLPISKEYSSGTSTYPHLKAIPIGYSLKILLRSYGPVSKDRVGLTVYSITNSPATLSERIRNATPLSPILIILAGLGSASADLDLVFYLHRLVVT
jgi:hypothetical protein